MLLGCVLVCMAIVFAFWSHRFGPATGIGDEPVLMFVAAAMLGALIWALLVPLLHALAGQTPHTALIGAMVTVGLVLRAAMFWSEPVLENDYHRYLWDGAVLAHGFDPYRNAPEAALALGLDQPLGALAAKAAPTIAAIGYPQLRTLYPPVAEAGFALAHLLGPFSLNAWRGVILACELVTLGLLLQLLTVAGRPLLWASLYWWSPLAVKELSNSGHMEALLLPPLLGALLLAVTRRPLWASASLAIAAGVKLWPVLLLPLVLRATSLHEPDQRRSLLAQACVNWPIVLVFSAVTALWAVPYLSAALGEDAGLVAYAQDWQTFSALMPLLERLCDALSAPWAGDLPMGDQVARVVVAVLASGAAIGIAWRQPKDVADLIGRFGLLALAVFLLSPSQFPWYALWWLPFLPFLPWPSLMALGLALPLYYSAFHLMPRDRRDLFEGLVIWVAWVPVWLMLARDLYNRRAWLQPSREG
jgi:alpha-1,6-mannosyltransferase